MGSNGGQEYDEPNLEFTTTDELVDELMKRFDTAFVVGLRKKTEEEQAEAIREDGAAGLNNEIICYESVGGMVQLMGLAQYIVESQRQVIFETLQPEFYVEFDASSDGSEDAEDVENGDDDNDE